MPRVLSLLVALLIFGLACSASATAATPSAGTAAKAKRKQAAAKKRCTKKRTAAQRRAAARRRRAAARRRPARASARKRSRCRKVAKRRPARPKPPQAPAPAAPPIVDGGVHDATVVAVLDFGVNPYHWDFLASKMPQHQDADRGNDLPLDRPATEWLPGLGDAPAFTRVDLTLEGADAELPSDDLRQTDEERWKQVQPSTVEAQNVYWFPNTKVIGAMTYLDDRGLLGANDDHGVGTTSASVGNLHGTCPECLLFFIQLGDTDEEVEAAIEWAERQPWIDAISNSYGLSLTDADRTRVYGGSYTAGQRMATQRGQTIFFSAGNGNDGAFVTPNSTTFSSQEGPDWIVTVGAVSPGAAGYYDESGSDDLESGPYAGAGKPADIAGVGSQYPTAYTATTVGGTGASGFGGTSNATPVIAGLYSRTLYMARKALRGPSRAQAAGVVATGEPYACGSARPACELADGRLTGAELRTRLFHGALHSPGGMAVYAQGESADPTFPQVGEEEFLAEGHGAYLGRVGKDRSLWLREFERLVGPLTGADKTLARPDGEHEWMVVDSYCRQKNWGAWSLGYYVHGVTPLPGPDPDWPVRLQREQTCPGGRLAP